MKILSVHNGHDPNATFLTNDKIFTIEEERISRIKHKGNDKSKEYINNLIKNFDYDIKVNIASDNEENVITDFFYTKEKEITISHHLAHASYVYYTRPEYINDCDILVYDGWGWETDKYFFNKKLQLIDTTTFGLGIIWELMSLRYYNKFNQEGKLMGLSSFGKFNNTVYNRLEKAINVLRTTNGNEYRTIIVKEAKSYLVNMYYEFEIQDIIKTFQVFSEEKVMEYIQSVKTSKNLLISGGIGLNGYINQKLEDLYDKVHISPATSDTGLSIGGVLYASKKRLIKPAYLGRQFNITEELLKAITNMQLKYTQVIDEELYDYISSQIIKGKIIGWYQGKSESGPRALGNRSILADPRSGIIKEYINKYIKHREWYRPYAPAILKEYASDWFENTTDSPYMLKIDKYKKGKGELVAGVCHHDYTGRVQTVTEEDNKKFYNLIKSFYKKTNIPILLNTSFNVNEPIVDTPTDALKTFVNSNIDILVLHNYIIEKPNDRFIIPNSKS